VAAAELAELFQNCAQTGSAISGSSAMAAANRRYGSCAVLVIGTSKL
jgi:hypothetical protein